MLKLSKKKPRIYSQNDQKIPKIGDKTSYDNLRITISEKQGSRISKVRVRRRPEN